MPDSSNGKAFIRVTLGIVATLVAAGIVGGVVAGQRLSAVESRQAAQESRLERIEDKIDRLIERPR